MAVQAAFSLVVSWPLVWWLGVGIPNGTERAATVAFFNLYSFRWNEVQVAELFGRYWDGLSFHPEPGAFALSDPQPLTGLVFTPFSWAVGPVVAYNVIVLLALTLNGVAAARLARRLGAGEVPAVLVGLVAQVLPFAMDQLGVIQLAMFFPLLFLADALLAWTESATWPRALAIGGWLSATLFTCGYYGLIALVVIVPAALVLVRRDWFGRRRLLQLAGAALLFGVVCSPFFVAQARYTSAYSRSERTILGNSAPPGAYLMLNQRLPGADVAPWLRDDAPLPLYPGTVLVGLAVAGAVVVVRERTGQRERARAVAFLGMAMALGVLLSLGLNLEVLGWQPYRLLREHVPGFGILRTPFRAAVIAQAFLLPIAAVALDRVWCFVPSGGIGERARPWLGRVLASVLVVVALAEVWPAAQPLVEVPRVGRGTDWVDWLAEPRHPATGDGSIAMVPFPADGDYASYEPTTVWMLASLDHGRSIVNGYSSLFPPVYNELERAMRQGFPSEDTVTLLSRRGVSWVVVTRDWLAGEDRQTAMDRWSAVLQPAFEGRDAVVYRLARLP